MCKITKKSRRKTFTGYKSVVVINGHFYSPATGIEYKVGSVPKIRKKRAQALLGYVDMLDKNSDAYDPKMVGKTGVGVDKFLVERYFEADAIIKMTISGDLHEGHIVGWGGEHKGDLIVGNHIDKIELLKQ